MLVKTAYEHIFLDHNNVPMIKGTTMKVVELVLDTIAYGWSPEELRFQHPQLTMGQIHSALAYYWDHRDEVEQDIQRRLAKVDAMQKSLPPTSLEVRLRRGGLI